MDTLLSVPSLSPEPTTKHHHHQQTPTQHAIPPPPPPHMPTSESVDRRLSRIGSPQQEKLPCPRCNSTNTKFCYYNNYNLSQPRHLCKSCRRYWTRGGTLRAVPFGGGTSKSAVTSNKRPRISTTSTPSTSSADNNDVSGQTQTRPEPKITDPLLSNPVSGMGSWSVVDSKEAASTGASESVWWSGQMGVGDGGLFALSGYGLGSELSYGLGVLDWPMEPVGELGVMPTGGASEGSIVNADNFSWPEIAISTPSKSLK